MKARKCIKSLLAASIALSLTALALTGCGGPAASPSAPASNPAPAASLQTVDFGSLLDSFTSGQLKSGNWDRTNLIAADTTTTATIGTSHGENNPVIMLKGNSGKMTATDTTSGTLDTDPSKNSYFASMLLLKNGSPAQYGDGIFKFSMRASAPAQGVWNNQVIFRTSAPQKLLTDPAVTKALAIQTFGGAIQLIRNYTDSSGKVVQNDLVKDTGVKVDDKKYHYFILAMQDVASGTNVKLWIDGAVAFSGVVTGIQGPGAIQLFNNSTPQYDAAGKPLVTTGVQAGTFASLTACGETYVGGYNDGPAVSDVSLDPAK